MLMERCKLCRGTVVDWRNLFREVCSLTFREEPSYIGTAQNPIQVDESDFSGRRKKQCWSHADRGFRAQNEYEEMEPERRESGLPLNEKKNQIEENQVAGPWVFGVYASRKQVRCFIVDDLKGASLIALIRNTVELGSFVVSDQWLFKIDFFVHGVTWYRDLFICSLVRCSVYQTP